MSVLIWRRALQTMLNTSWKTTYPF